MQRREFITVSGAAAIWLLTGCGGSSDSGGGNTGGGNVGSGSAGHPGNPNPAPGELAIPPLLDPASGGGAKHFNLSIQEGSMEFFPGISTRTYGISANYLGPTLLLRRGEQVAISYTNNLGEATTMHGHGMHLPAAMDGGPHQVIMPGSTWTASYTVNQKACTNWYHPHLMGKTAEQVFMGLAGMIIIEDNESGNIGLPNRYAVDDIPLVVQDKVFDSNRQIRYAPSRRDITNGYMGDTFLVNGVIQPYFNAEAKALRLRILNGSNARVYTFGFNDGRAFHQVATDNSFLPAPVALTAVRLSPGERAEIVVDLSADFGGNTILRDLASGANLMTINVNKESSGGGAVPPALTNSLEIPSMANAVRTRSFVLGMRMMRMTINGKSMDLNRIDEQVPLGDLEIWEISNSMGVNHNFHIHGTHFYVMERDGSSANVPANERGYKDVVFLPPNSSVKLLVKMTDYRDPNSPFMYHCHVLEHEDDGMMGQFTVV